MYYAITTFGPGPKGQRVFKNLEAAKQAAFDHADLGVATDIYIYRCDSLALAESADISEIRPGERLVAAVAN